MRRMRAPWDSSVMFRNRPRRERHVKIIDFENHFCTQTWVDAVFANKKGYPRLVNAPDGMLRM